MSEMKITPVQLLNVVLYGFSQPPNNNQFAPHEYLFFLTSSVVFELHACLRLQSQLFGQKHGNCSRSRTTVRHAQLHTCRDQALPSWMAVAVSPAAVLPVPLVCTLRVLSCAAHFMSCDLPAFHKHPFHCQLSTSSAAVQTQHTYLLVQFWHGRSDAWKQQWHDDGIGQSHCHNARTG